MDRVGRENLANVFASLFGSASTNSRPLDVRDAPKVKDIEIADPRLIPAKSLKEFISRSPHERLSHSRGKSFIDVVRSFHGEFSDVPDLVAFPRTEPELMSIIDWCYSSNVAIVTYGGGSSVVGGVNCPSIENYQAVLSLDTTCLDKVLEVDSVSRSALIQAGVLGPALESQLKQFNLTMRHYPQSFEFSTLGGWIATKSGGHYATNQTRIDDFTQSLRVVTPAGIVETSRFPSSGAGPDQNGFFLGSEGIYGIITQAWMRLQDRPQFKDTVGVKFSNFGSAVDACRIISQSGLYPTNCRLLDAVESFQSAGVTNGNSLLIVGFESAHCPVDNDMKAALEICSDHGGIYERDSNKDDSKKANDSLTESDSWKSTFTRAPYLRDAIISIGHIAETFETSVTWDKFSEFHSQIMQRVRSALDETCGTGVVSCRFTHLYPDGPAPYYTVVAPSSHEDQIHHWSHIKDVVSSAIIELGGTITHHHAVGKDHVKWYHQEIPKMLLDSIERLKELYDPKSLLNPGVLLGSEGH